MGRRKAIGASLAAAVIFSSLVVSGLTVSLASRDRLRLAGTAEVENADHISFELGVGVVSISALDDFQHSIESRTWDCSTFPWDEATIASTSVALNQSGLSVSEASSLGGPVTEPDNDSLVNPFNGSLSSGVNLLLVVKGSAESPSVTFGRTERHTVHLPLDAAAATSLCMTSSSSVAANLALLDLCNQTSSEAAMVPIIDSLVKTAFDAGVNIHVILQAGSSACSVDYVVTASIVGVRGPLGEFTFREEVGGTVSTRQTSTAPSP